MGKQETFEDKIKDAAIERAFEYFDDEASGIDVHRTDGIHDVFADGIKWFRENIWHKWDEQPEPKKNVFCATSFMRDDGRIDDGVDVCCLPFALTQEEWERFAEEMGVSHWCYESDLYNK